MAKTDPKPPDAARPKPDEPVKTSDSEKPIVISRRVFSDFAMI
ncbi:hypothetical protein [Roseovarius sp.]